MAYKQQKIYFSQSGGWKLQDWRTNRFGLLSNASFLKQLVSLITDDELLKNSSKLKLRFVKIDIKRFYRKKCHIYYPKKILPFLVYFNPESLKPHVFCPIMHGDTTLLGSKTSP